MKSIVFNWFVLLSLGLLLPIIVHAENSQAPPTYTLELGFEIDQHLLKGSARIELKAGQVLTLDIRGLTITGMDVKRQGTSQAEPANLTSTHLIVPASPSKGTLSLNYTYTPSESSGNVISQKAITLLSGWHPQPLTKMLYRLKATLPSGMTAITESDAFPLTQERGSVSSSFGQPIIGPHFIAGHYLLDTLKVREGLNAHTLFFKEDSQLSSTYLSHVKNYLLRYEQELGPYPYNHFVVVANQKPTGLGMPSFTLLGQSVLRLPFITTTSLGHEVLHSWFGNGITVTPDSGNWSEGLTAYLADHAYRQDNNEGRQYRYESLTTYLSYVHSGNVIPLHQFTSPSHNQQWAKARRAVGYNRAMFLFHELQVRLGDELFEQGMREFVSRFMFKDASWKDLQQVFSEVLAKPELSAFFDERLKRTDIPSLALKNIEIQQQQEGIIFHATVQQKTEEPYTLQLPLTFELLTGVETHKITTSKLETDIQIGLQSRPLSVTIDAELSMLRQPDEKERRVSWSRLLGSGKMLVVTSDKKTGLKYQPLLKALGKSDELRYSNDVSNAELAENDLLFLGVDQRSVHNLFGKLSEATEGFTLDVRPNPLATDRVVALISSSSSDETAAVAYRLSHYGKYTQLKFRGGRSIEKQLPTHDYGIHYQLEQLPSGIATNSLSPFSSLVTDLLTNDIIYIGESHTSASDHRLQLRLIESLYQSGKNLVIGMEMFPSASQPALDNYILGSSQMTEKEFLKDSKYFDVWRYDYRYYREILQFAREHRIPVIGLNLERDIVSSVYRNGSTDQLEPEVSTNLVQDRDLSLPGYGERLRIMHGLHQQEGHGSGQLSGFIQAQSLWDETMAENIVKQYQTDPERTIVVLAGNEHTRKDSGIPPRVARRIDVKQATVLNITDQAPPTNISAVADHAFFSDYIHLPPAPLMGITLREEQRADTTSLIITGFTETSQADEVGLKIGDRLRALNNIPLSTMADVRIAMTTRKKYDEVEVRVERTEDSGPSNHLYIVPLTKPKSANPHR